MSIKIYEAYRIPIEKINDFLLYVRETGYSEFLPRFLTYVKRSGRIESYATSDVPDWLEGEKIIGYACKRAADDCYDEIQQEEQHDTGAKHRYSSSLNVWVKGEHAYIIPYGVRLNNLPEYAVDYHYQDQTDIPEGISEEEYEGRYEVWLDLCLDDWDNKRLVYEIVSFGKFYSDTYRRAIDFIMENCKQYALAAMEDGQ